MDPVVWAVVIVALFVVVVTMLMSLFLLFALVRERVNVSRMQEQIDQLTTAVNSERGRREDLEIRFATLQTQYGSLLDLFQRMNVMPQASPDSIIAGLPFLQDERFRKWLREHFDTPGLALLAADCGLSEPASSASLDAQAGALIAEARRVNAFRMLESKAFDRRPGVPRP